MPEEEQRNKEQTWTMIPLCPRSAMDHQRPIRLVRKLWRNCISANPSLGRCFFFSAKKVLLSHASSLVHNGHGSLASSHPMCATYSDLLTSDNFTIKGFLSHWIQLFWSSQFSDSGVSCMSKLHNIRARIKRISRYARLGFP